MAYRPEITARLIAAERGKATCNRPLALKASAGRTYTLNCEEPDYCRHAKDNDDLSLTRLTSSPRRPTPSVKSDAAQQETTGHRGRAGDPLHGIRTILRAGQKDVSDRQHARLQRAIAADDTSRRGVHRLASRSTAAFGLPIGHTRHRAADR